MSNQSPPTKWASIAPRFEGDKVKRAPKNKDTHNCRNAKSILEVVYFGGWWLKCGQAVYPILYCPYCGGLLPTEQEHE